MKRIKKFVSLMLAAVMVLAMGITASAEGTNTITVDVNFKGQDYTLYKLFNATTTSDREEAEDKDSKTEVETGGIAYTLIDEKDTENKGHGLNAKYTIEMADGEVKTVQASDWFAYTGTGESSKNLKVKEGVDTEFVKSEEFRLFAKNYGKQIGETLTASEDNDSTIKWENLEEGYYFISTTTGTFVTVTSIAPNAIVKDKNEIPTVEKTVQEDSIIDPKKSGDGISGYQKQNDQEIGGTVYFKTVIGAKPGASGYVLMDKMDSALTFSLDSIKVYKGSVADENLVPSTGYTAKLKGKYGTETDGATFTVTFEQTFLDSITADTDIIVLYTATVNDNAIINTAIQNKTVLEYGNEILTEESTTNTFVWGIDVLKYDGEDKEEVKSKVLKGAQFVIYRTETETETETENEVLSVYYAKFDEKNKFSGWVKDDTITKQDDVSNLVKKDSDYFTEAGATVLETGENGTIAVTGLDEGTYNLLEVKAPNGYNKLDKAVTVTIDSTSDDEVAKELATKISAGDNGGSKNVPVSNNKGSLLPSTGGIGTTIFYVVGGILVIGAGILLVAKKRMGARK